MICCFWLILRITLPNRELHTLCCPLLGHLRAVLSRLRRDRTIRGKTKQKYSAFKATMKLLLFYLGFFEDSCLCDDTLDKLLSYSRPLQRERVINDIHNRRAWLSTDISQEFQLISRDSNLCDTSPLHSQERSKWNFPLQDQYIFKERGNGKKDKNQQEDIV